MGRKLNMDITPEIELLLFECGFLHARKSVIEEVTGINHTVVGRHLAEATNEIGAHYIAGATAREKIISMMKEKVMKPEVKREPLPFKTVVRRGYLFKAKKNLVTCDGFDLTGWCGTGIKYC